MTTRVLITAFCLAWLAAGCRQDPQLASINLAPLANAGADQQVASAGATTKVSLDGSGSSDPDGQITAYRWFNATGKVDGGVAFPAGQSDAAWPEDAVKPELELPDGVWSFSLWVVDEDGAVSEPSTVKITVGDPDALADPEVAACAMDVLPSVPTSCAACVCNPPNASEEIVAGCRMNVVQGKCDQGCWDLINCTARQCPDFSKGPAPDFGCLTANCGAFLGSGAAAMAAGGCVIACASACPAPN